MSKVILESPFANENKQKFINNYLYLCVCARKMMLVDDDAPLFFHALYTQFLHDDNPDERNKGLYKSFEYHSDADYKTYAIDRGISNGMMLGAKDALEKGMKIEFYTVLPDWTYVAGRIKNINLIPNMLDRWNAGVEFVNELHQHPINKKSFDETGDLTVYSLEVDDDLKDVKQCLNDFFRPIIFSICNE